MGKCIMWRIKSGYVKFGVIVFNDNFDNKLWEV